MTGLLRHALPISLLILRKTPTVLQSREDREEGKTKKGLVRGGRSIPFSPLLLFSHSPLPLPFLRRLEFIYRDLKILRIAVMFFNAYRRKPSLGAPA